jgi:DNA polymerase-3 subunit delta'
VLGFDAIIDQERPIRILLSHLQKGTIPHALLFTGIEGVGKKTAALALAMACNCAGGGPGIGAGPDGRPEAASAAPPAGSTCGECEACRKIAAGNHPDVLRVSAAGAMIKIEQVRELCRVLTLRPYEARMRVAIIEDAHLMNAAAGNALLKILEEPPDRTVLILTALQTQDLLPTLVSRCQNVRFKPIARHHLAAVLQRAYGFSPEEASITAGMADGSVTRALSMQRSQRLIRRNWLMAELSQMQTKSPAWPLMLAEALSRTKEDLQQDLGLIAVWLRDLAVARFDPERVLSVDLKDRLAAQARSAPPSFPVQAAGALREARRRIGANANPRLTVEAFLVKMVSLYGGRDCPPVMHKKL